MAGRTAEVAGVSALAAIITVLLAVPVLRAPSDRIFGMEVVGRHHDPFTVMRSFDRPFSVGLYSQPITDLTGALLARVSGAVAAYNWLVLISFPLAAAAAYVLARHLSLSPVGATVAAIAFAFSPFHLAHAAYHPHIAQIQWVPLYLLALWRCLDRASPPAVGFLCAATLGVTLSNFYGGFIAAVITPVAVAAYWLVMIRRQKGSLRQLSITIGSLVLIASLAMAYVFHAAGAVIADRASFSFPRADLFRYSAKWWSYLVPPVEHPVVGSMAGRIWSAAGIGDGLLEQQVYLGWGIIALAVIAGFQWLVRDRQSGAIARVPVLIIVASVALLCSLSPERTIGTFTFVRPSAFLYEAFPMFRSYARFGVVVQLMAALLAGIGVDYLRRTGSRRGTRLAAIALLALVLTEYAVAPSSLWRDVLPTAAHRWVTQQPGPVRALDCVPLTPESESIAWLTNRRVTMMTAADDCMEPNLPQKLAAAGLTHLLVRRNTTSGRFFSERAPMNGLQVAASLGDSQVYAVTAPAPSIYTSAMTGFFRREVNPEWTWRWMAADASWTIVNTGDQPLVATAAVELSAFGRTRLLEVQLDRRTVQRLVVDTSRRFYEIGPLAVGPDEHELMFHPVEEPTLAADLIDNGDRRRLSFALGTWSWTVQPGEPR